LNEHGEGRLFAAEGKRRIFLRVTALALAAFAAGYVLTTVVFFPGFGRQAIVTVPDLRGKTLAEARGLASAAGVEVERGDSLFHPSVAAGAVLAQSPLPGQEVTRGSVVRVTLSAGREQRPVPEVEDLPAVQAESLLVRMGFTVSVRRVLSDRAEGRVLSVNPQAGTVLPVGSIVELTLSSGPPPVVVQTVAVPDIGGMPEPAAREALRSAGLRLGEVRYEQGLPVPLGGVASQSPAAGDSVRAGSPVNVVVSGSPPTGVDAPSPPPPAPDSAAPAADQTPP